ncbi:MAG: ABC transporter substrate-binding protein [Alphaproteobacteria bacterium]
MKKAQPLVSEAKEQMDRGVMDRREFVRYAALLGVAAGTAYAIAGLPAPAMAAMGALPFPADDPAAKTGGTLRVAMQVQKMIDPATYSWTAMSNQSRQIIEYLTITDPENITRPMLAESWSASDDLKTWTLKLRKGVMWHNGDELTANDVVFNVTRWLDPKLGSSNVGLSTFSAMVNTVDSGEKDKDGKPKMIKVMIPGAVEAVDKYTVRFNLKKPVLSVAEDCYNYPTAIVHSSFKPPFSDKPIGTGPFTLVSQVVGDKCILKRVSKMSNGKPFKYWGGKVYLDEIHYYNFSSDNQVTAFASGDADAIYSFGVEQFELAKTLDGNILSASTAQTLVCRMNVTKAPFTDARLRKAVVMAVDNAKIMELVYSSGAALGENHHVAPLHPEYFALPPLKRDVEGAKKLLAEAGHADGIELTINIGNTDGPWHQAVAEAMRDQLKDVGIKLNVNVMPETKYWGVWTSAPFSATSWTHRPLGTMVLSLAYRSGVPWNESGYSNKDFEVALDAAEATLDIAKRSALMEKVEKYIQDDAIMIQALWRPVYTIVSKKVHGYPAHPTQYHQFNKVWMS